MEFTLLDSTGNLIYQRGQQENGTHAVDSLWYLPFVALQNVLRTELDDDGITSLRDDGSLIVFRQVLALLITHDSHTYTDRLANTCPQSA